MTSREFLGRLREQAEKADVSVPAGVQDQLEAYFRLLSRWNAKINLTSLPLSEPTDLTFDRLLIEPIVATAYVTEFDTPWFDLGSGGGSPAIPLKLMHPGLKLTMVEVRERKAVFLREAVRTLELASTDVLNDTVEHALADPAVSGLVQIITARALRIDESLLSSVERGLAPNGRVMLFRSGNTGIAKPSSFETVESVPMRTTNSPVLTIFRKKFHVEQNRSKIIG